jgi:beta-lactamase superfamily II metal-dependent hydrolase
MTRVNAEGAEVEEARKGETIVVGNLVFDVLFPWEPLVADTNSNSVVLRLIYGDTGFLFTGDAEEAFESSMIASSVMFDIDILKIAHHGSRSSLFPLFLSIVKPEVAIYMAGEDNTYGHPHPETIQALEDIGAEIYGTDVCGTITVTTYGTDYTVSDCTP